MPLLAELFSAVLSTGRAFGIEARPEALGLLRASDTLGSTGRCGLSQPILSVGTPPVLPALRPAQGRREHPPAGQRWRACRQAAADLRNADGGAAALPR